MSGGGEPALCDMKEMEWERHAFADKLAKSLGVPLHGVKAAPPAWRDSVVLGLHDAGFTVRQIEHYTGIGKSTVSRIVRTARGGDADWRKRDVGLPVHRGRGRSCAATCVLNDWYAGCTS